MSHWDSQLHTPSEQGIELISSITRVELSKLQRGGNKKKVGAGKNTLTLHTVGVILETLGQEAQVRPTSAHAPEYDAQSQVSILYVGMPLTC